MYKNTHKFKVRESYYYPGYYIILDDRGKPLEYGSGCLEIKGKKEALKKINRMKLQEKEQRVLSKIQEKTGFYYPQNKKQRKKWLSLYEKYWRVL